MRLPAGAGSEIGAALRACRRAMAAVALFSCLESLLMLAGPLYMLQVYDRVLASRSGDTLLYLTLLMLFAFASLAAIDLARGNLLGRVGLWLDGRLSPMLFERAVQARLRGRPYGTEALADLATLRSFVASPGMAALFDLPWTVVYVAVAYLMHPWLGHLAVAAAALLMALAAVGEIAARGPVRAAHQASTAARRDLEATSRNAEVVEAMGMMPALADRWRRGNEAALALQAATLRRTAFLGSLTKFTRLAVQSLGLALGAWLVLQEQATGGIMIAASILLSRALAPIEQCIGSWRGLIAARAALARLAAVEADRPHRAEAMRLPPLRGDLSVEGVTLQIGAGTPPVLRQVSFRLAAGESVAIIGPSGAGKSTLARLLVGVEPASAGCVRIDGGDVFRIARDQIGDVVGYLPQDVELFAGTVGENIARLGPVDPDAVVAAARLAGVHELILRLPDGYGTEIGDGGRHLSGGQRQRIALARALYGGPKLVVLDEPNANLDGEGEDALAAAIQALKAAGTTVVLITHRPSLVQAMDRMLLLRDGAVELFGPRNDVLARMVGAGPRRAPGPAAPTGPVVVPLQQEA